MKKLFVTILLVIFFPAIVNAAKFEGLNPGESTKADADAKLGKPIREVIKGRRYDYDPEKHEARRVSLEFMGEEQIIKTINIYFIRRYARDKVKGWFDLTTPFKEEIDNDGNLVEYYVPKLIAFHYDGPDQASPIKYLSHFDKSILTNTTAISNIITNLGGSGNDIREGEQAFLGVEVTPQEDGLRIMNVLRASPAKKAGLKKGDIIKRVENYDFEDGMADSQDFADIISDMPVGKPILFYIERGTLGLDINIALEAVDKKEVEALVKKNKDKAKQLYQKAVAARRDGTWMRAIKYLKQAIQLDATEAVYAADLANAYYRIGDDEKAVAAMERAVSLNPDYRTHLGMGRIYINLKEYDKALSAFRKAERLKPRDVDDVEIFTWLGAAYFHTDDLDEAIGYSLRAFRKSKKRSALAAFYLGACFDKKGNARDAMYYYNRFLKLKSDDEKREVLARTRLKELKNDPDYKAKKEQSRQSWMKVFGAVADGVQGVESDQWDRYPSESQSTQSQDYGWDEYFNKQQQDTRRYDDIFTMPPR